MSSAKLIQIFFTLFVALFLGLEIASGEGAKKIVFLGDSLTIGYGVSKDEAYPSVIRKRLTSQGLNVEIINSSVSGSTSASGVARMQWILKSKPNIVVIALGSNDGLRGFPVAVTKKNLEQMIHLASGSHVRVVLAGLEVPVNYGEKYRADFRKIFTELKDKNQIELIPFLLDGVAGEKTLNQSDSIHPNAKGHERIAENVLPFIEKALK